MINIGAPDFSKLKTFIHNIICVKDNFIQQPSKMTTEPSQRGNVLCDANGTKNSINFKNDDLKEYKTY